MEGQLSLTRGTAQPAPQRCTFSGCCVACIGLLCLGWLGMANLPGRQPPGLVGHPWLRVFCDGQLTGALSYCLQAELGIRRLVSMNKAPARMDGQLSGALTYCLQA